MLTKNWKPLAVAGPNRFLEGTNWVSVAAGHWEEAGIQSDGSLWVSESPAKPRILRKTDKRPQPQPAKLVRFGDRNDWKSIGGGYGNSMFLLKTNGTLWLWGTNLCNGGQSWRGLRSFEPQRLGGDADWVEIGFSDDRAVFHKADGRAWVHSPYATSSDTDSVELAPKMYIERAPHLDQRGWRSLTSFHTRWASGSAGVHEDGTLRVNGICQGMAKSPSGQRNLAKQFVQLGQETNWLTSSATGPGETIVALKTDGSLWKWNFPDAPGARPDQAHAVRLGTHSDWLAVAPLMGGVASLAVDGSLWFWRFEPPYYYGAPDWPSHPLLAPSRRPTRLGNIFDGSN